MTNKRVQGLTVEPILSFDQNVILDKTAYSEAKGMPTSTLLRTRVKNEVDETGKASGTIDFTSYNEIVVTIDQDYQGTFAGIGNNETVYLHVIKGASDVFTPYRPVTGTVVIENTQQGLTHVIYRITTNTTSALYYSFIVEPINSQTNGALVSSKFAVSSATIISFDHFAYYTNRNRCDFSGQFEIQTSGVLNTIIITITDWNLTPTYSENATWSYVSSPDVTTLKATQSLLEDTTTLTIKLDSSLGSGDTATVIFNGSMIIE